MDKSSAESNKVTALVDIAQLLCVEFRNVVTRQSDIRNLIEINVGWIDSFETIQV